MIKKSFIIIFAFLFHSVLGVSQNNPYVDSLKTLVKQLDNNAKVDVYTKLCWELRNSKPENTIKYGNKAIKLAAKINYNEGLVKAYSFTGIANRNIGNYSKAFDYYFKGLELAEKYNIPEQKAYAYINIGNLYLYQKKPKEAMINLKEALDIANTIQNAKIIAYCYLNMGRAEMLNNNLDVAKAYFIKSLKIRKTLNDNEKIAASNKYIADVYAAQNNFDMAIAYYKKALFGVDKNGDLDLLADIYNKVANLYYKEGRYKLSINNALMSLKISKRIKAKPRIRDAHQTLAKTYIAKGDHEKASLNLNYVIKLNQELFNQQLSEKILNISYSMEKEQKQKKINELNTQKKNQFFFIVVLAIVILLGLSFLIISFRLNFLYKDANKLLKHQNSEISIKNEELNNQNEEIRSIADNLTKANTKILLQKEVIEKSHYQITSSINYAKRIQTAILPDEDNLNIIFPEHLLFYKARDIVSGDFYWIKKIENCKIMAVADCTGHGVPGAFLSMLGITLLNEIMQKDKLSKVSLVLDMLRKQIKTSLKQTGKYYNNKDGMDFAICSINTDTNQMVYSGANNPVYIIRKNLIETEINPDVNKKIKTYKLENNKYRLIEIKPDRQPIGSYIKESPFSDIQFKLQKNDSIFLFSDGYYDQFNGETGKKFSNTRFRELLIAIADRKMADQQKMLNETFNNWKKNSPQVDDVLILGVKV